MATFMISVEDMKLLEHLEEQRDSAEMKAAFATDDGGRVSIETLVAELDAEEAAAATGAANSSAAGSIGPVSE